MPVMMYKGDEQQIVENCLVDKMKAEGWGLRTLEETVKVAEEPAADPVESDEPEVNEEVSEKDVDETPTVDSWL